MPKPISVTVQGKHGSGKSSLVKQFNQSYESNRGKISISQIRWGMYRLDFTDTNFKNEDSTLKKYHAENKEVCLYCVALDKDIKSNKIAEEIALIKEGNPNIAIILVGTKFDLLVDNQRYTENKNKFLNLNLEGIDKKVLASSKENTIALILQKNDELTLHKVDNIRNTLGQLIVIEANSKRANTPEGQKVQTALASHGMTGQMSLVLENTDSPKQAKKILSYQAISSKENSESNESTDSNSELSQSLTTRYPEKKQKRTALPSFNYFNKSKFNSNFDNKEKDKDKNSNRRLKSQPDKGKDKDDESSLSLK